ncbi:hypothetical protein TNIN_78441 [Trichonephila inaurata madagascariensis]|uniref:Uncharacterized protein n=1 Tax=Trichonephila inaurata madagascariensis TaxID=2747483 RepID=A0A8X6KBY7_9ARAC|nr:hypothetical protein TNIN_78441 [Trichonephila inaurata madagascariensis]
MSYRCIPDDEIDLVSLIRTIVREEVHRLVNQTQESLDSNPQSLEEIVQDEVERVLAPVSAKPTETDHDQHTPLDAGLSKSSGRGNGDTRQIFSSHHDYEPGDGTEERSDLAKKTFEQLIQKRRIQIHRRGSYAGKNFDPDGSCCYHFPNITSRHTKAFL